jgi:hypothetical protein
MQRLISAFILVLFAGLASSSELGAAKHDVVVIRRPTVVAFFVPARQGELKNQADINEALDDFQFYAARVRKPLNDAGIDFEEVYASSFHVRRGSRTTTFRPGKVKVGYYFVAPNKEPHVEYGMMTDTDLFQFAQNYFAPPGAPARPSEYCLAEHISPNLELKHDTRISGRITDEAGAAFRHSRIELRSFVSQSEQITVKSIVTDDDGKFGLGVVKQGNYRLLLSPNRGFKQPAKLECLQKNCTLDTVLILNPSDMPGAGCPIR